MVVWKPRISTISITINRVTRILVEEVMDILEEEEIQTMKQVVIIPMQVVKS